MEPTRYFDWTVTLAANGFDALSRYDANVDHTSRDWLARDARQRPKRSPQ